MTTSVTPAGYLGDFKPTASVYFMFHTHNSSLAPATLAGTPAISVYYNANTTQSTSGVTLAADFDSVTGLASVTIDTSSDGTFYASGRTFSVVITTGTVNSVSVVGAVVATFTLDRGVNVDRIGASTQSLTDLKDFADTGYDPATHGVALSTQGKADVNGEVIDVLATDTHAQPSQGAPAATTSYANMLGYLYKALRNKKTQTATTWSLFNDDAATVDHKSTVSNDGTTATFGEIASGP